MARPRVTVHFAQTLDGRIATRSGSSQWISCPGSLRLAHELRRDHAAVMVGVGTVIADDPRLTVRLVSGPSPLRIVVDTRLRIPTDALLLQDPTVPTLVICTELAAEEDRHRLRRTGAEVLTVASGRGGVNLCEVLDQLGRRGVTSLLIEGGKGVITSALASSVVDRVVVCIAPKILGEGIAAVGDLGIQELSRALSFEKHTFSQLDGDIIFDGLVSLPDPSG